MLDDVVDRLDYATSGMEQAQLVCGSGPDLGQDGRIQRRVVSDYLGWLNTSCFQPLQERLDAMGIDALWN